MPSAGGAGEEPEPPRLVSCLITGPEHEEDAQAAGMLFLLKTTYIGDRVTELVREYPGHEVMIVEDEGPMRFLLGEHVRDTGRNPILCSDGHDAVKALRKLGKRRYNGGVPSLVLIADFHMPGMNGIETYGKIRGMYPTSSQL